MGSVKDLLVIDPAFENRPGLGNFIFSDRYSVFDWGEMPDHVPNKGRALAMMAAHNFEELERRGMRTHYQGMVAPGGRLFRIGDRGAAAGGSNVMQVRLARVYRPVAREFMGEKGAPEVLYDYSFFEANRGRLNNYLVGLEIIFRNGLPLGSSVFARLARAKAIPEAGKSERELAAILGELGLEREPAPGQMLPKPVMSYTTKLEEGDRPLGEAEARYISGLTDGAFGRWPAWPCGSTSASPSWPPAPASSTTTARWRWSGTGAWRSATCWAPSTRTASPWGACRSARRCCASGTSATSRSSPWPASAGRPRAAAGRSAAT